MLHVGAVLLDVFTEVGSNLAVALEQVFAGHTLLAGSTTRGDDILSAREGYLGVNGIGEVGTRECAVAHLIVHAVYAGLVDIIETDVGGEAEHQHALHHVGADHTTGTYNHEFFVS